MNVLKTNKLDVNKICSSGLSIFLVCSLLLSICLHFWTTLMHERTILCFGLQKHLSQLSVFFCSVRMLEWQQEDCEVPAPAKRYDFCKLFSHVSELKRPWSQDFCPIQQAEILLWEVGMETVLFIWQRTVCWTRRALTSAYSLICWAQVNFKRLHTGVTSWSEEAAGSPEMQINLCCVCKRLRCEWAERERIHLSTPCSKQRQHRCDQVSVERRYAKLDCFHRLQNSKKNCFPRPSL